jgi:hypothetical protein
MRVVGGSGVQGEPENFGGLGPASSEANENQERRRSPPGPG